MSRYLISTTETYRVDSEAAAQTIIAEAKEDNNFILAKYSTEYKERKSKGEVIDAYYKVTLNKVFTDIKEPDYEYEVSYSQKGAF